MWNPLHICGHLAIVLLTRSTISLQLCQILAISLQLWQLLAISLQLGVRQVGHYPERQTNNVEFPSQILRFTLVFVFVSVDAPPLSEFCPRLPWDNHNRWQKNILSPCESRLFWQNQLAELIFKKKKPRQNWSRDHFEATQKANFSILKPNFWSGDTAMGMAHWHNPKRVDFFSNILQNHYFVRWNSYFYQHCSGWLFFANFQTRISYFFTMGLSPCTAWVGDQYIGEVISPFRTLPRQKMTAQFQFFQSLPHKKADFVKKSR